MWKTKSRRNGLHVYKHNKPWVRVDTSHAVPSEDGLFASRDFDKDETIGNYEGDIVDSLVSRYVVLIRPVRESSRYIDGEYAGPPFMQMINDARGTDYVNNCRMLQSGRIICIRPINKGDELLMSYGKDYWSFFNPLH